MPRPHAEREPRPDHGVARIAPGVRCFACAYELAGLGIAGACPECGLPVAESLRADITSLGMEQARKWANRAILGAAAGIASSFMILLLLRPPPFDMRWYLLIAACAVAGAPVSVWISYSAFFAALPAALRQRSEGRLIRLAGSIATAAVIAAILLPAVAAWAGEPSAAALMSIGLAAVVSGGLRNALFIRLVALRAKAYVRTTPRLSLCMLVNASFCMLWSFVLVAGILDLNFFIPAALICGAAGFGFWIAWLACWLGTLESLARRT